MTLNTIQFEKRRQRRRAKVEREREEMHEYQKMAVELGKANPYFAFFIDLGLGKTVISLTMALDLWMDGDVDKILVIAPLKVANQTWPTEIATWGHTCMLRHSLVTGDKKRRLKAIQSDAPIHITNRESITWLVDHFGRDWPYDMVIIDESSGFKDHTSQRWKALKNVRPAIKRLIELTASPLAESYEFLFAQTYLLDRGERFGKFITKFREEHFTHNQWSRKYKVREESKDILIKKISDISLEMRAEDYLDMTECTVIERKVHLNDAQMEQYKRMSKDFMIEIVDEMGDELIIEAETASALAGKLLQMASGVIYQSEKVISDTDPDVVKRKVTHHYLHDLKLKELERMEEDLEGQNLLISYWFKSSLNRLKERFPDAVVLDREGSQVAAWNKGKIRKLLIHPASGAHGLNLQKGGHNLVFYDLPASYELYQQIIGRLHRQGQKKAVRVWPIITKGTDDEKALQRLRDKRDAQDYFYDKLKRYHAKIKRQQLAAMNEEL